MESDKKNEIVSAGEEATEVTVSPQQPVSTWRPQDADREVIKANIRRRVWTSNASPKAQFIPAKPLPTVQDDGRKTVAVYARVSTKSTEQVSSIENQTRYYTEKVEKTPNWEMLESYSWPGNIRQLKNVAEQISAIEPTRTITGEILRRYLPVETERSGVLMLTEPSAAKDRSDERELLYKVLFDLRSDMNDVKRMLAELIAERKYEAPKSDIAALLPRSNYPVTSPVRPAEEIFTDTEEVIDEPPHEEMTKEKAQREAIVRALRHHGGKRRDAARELFISERTLYRKMKELGIDDSCIKP